MEAGRARRRNKEQSPERIEAEARQDARLVAFPFHEQPGGDGDDEIGSEIGRLNEPGLRLGDAERFLKMLVQDIDEAVGQAPHEKKRGDEDEGLAILRTGDATHAAPPHAVSVRSRWT